VGDGIILGKAGGMAGEPPRLFTREVLEEMGRNAAAPLIFALSRPETISECTAEQVQDLGFRVYGPGFRVYGPGCSIYGPGCSIHSPGFRIHGPGCSIYGLGSSIYGPGSSIYGQGFSV